MEPTPVETKPTLDPVISHQKGEVIDDVSAHYGAVKRRLSPRHVQLMTIAGGIGVGLFVGIGGTLAKAGPLSLVLGYLFYGLMFIWPCNLCIAEMVTWLPIRGSIYELASRFVDPALGFAMGWTYFFAGTMIVCTEYSAVATVISYWNTDINPAVWVALVMASCFFLNMVAVRWYGESEFVMSSTKVLLLIGLILITLITMCGGSPTGVAYGFSSWGDNKFMLSYYTEGPLGRFLAFWISVRYAVFTVGGPDFVALSAGEMQNPRKTVPRTAKLIFYRIISFYVIGVLALGIICTSDDPRLLGAIAEGAAGSAASPWVIGMSNIGISGFLPGFINFLILLSGWSCGNAFLYASSRTLYSLAQDGHAPRIFLTCNNSGVPYWCVIAVSVISLISFLVASTSALTVFYWFLDLTTCALVVNFTAMFVVFLGWYRATVAQGIDRTTLPYYARFGPYLAVMGLIVGTLITLTIGFDIFEPFTARGFVTSYFGLGWFLFMFCLWKVVKKTKFVDPAEADFYTGKAEVDAECAIWESDEAREAEHDRLAGMNVFSRAWAKIW